MYFKYVKDSDDSNTSVTTDRPSLTIVRLNEVIQVTDDVKGFT